MGAQRHVRRAVTVILLVALVGAAALVYFNRQQISDHFAASSFEPSSEILQLTDRLSLTDDGHRVFFATHPTLESSQGFNEQCAGVDHSEDGHILGCYASGGIHLFGVTDPRLTGVVEVTAAHELLHATFERLSDGDRQRLSSRLMNLYRELAEEDPELAERMSVYDGLSERSFANELHSVLGTETRELPGWLEDHYAQWLQDRTSIVDYFEAYRDVFNAIQDRADELQEAMERIREDVSTRSDAYDAAVARFNTDVEEFNRRNAAYEFAGDEAQFWVQRAALEARAQALNEENAAIQEQVDRYNDLRAELEELSATNQELNQHLDSNLAPPVAPAST